MKWYTDEYTGPDTEDLEYDEDVAFNAVGEVLADLHGPKGDLETLCKEWSEVETIDDLSEESRATYEQILDEIYDRLVQNQFVPEDMNDSLPSESDELGDHIDDEVDMWLDMVSENYEQKYLLTFESIPAIL